MTHGQMLCQKLAQQDPTNTAWQRELSVSLEGIADVLMAQRKLDRALAAYQQSRQIRQKLAQQDPTNAGWQRELSGSLKWVGNVLMAQGNLDAALKNYRDGFAISEKLAGQDPSNANWLNDAAWSRYCIAEVLIQIKDSDRNEARRLVVERIDIMTRLEYRGTEHRRSRYIEQAPEARGCAHFVVERILTTGLLQRFNAAQPGLGAAGSEGVSRFVD